MHRSSVLFGLFGHHHPSSADQTQSETSAPNTALDDSGDTAVRRVIDGDQTAADGSRERTVCGVQILAPAGVRPAALDACADYVRAEIGRNEYAQRKLEKKKTTLVIIPANTQMTDLPQFSSLRGKETPAPDARHWETVRGSGGMQLPNGTFALAVPEENLVAVQSIFQGYGIGYSVGMHELAHTLEDAAMTNEQRNHVRTLYAERHALAQQKGSVQGIFTDAYAGTDEQEYFAQSTDCFFGKNQGEGKNGRDWLERHDPKMYAFLVTLYEHTEDKNGHEVVDPAKLA